MSCAQADEVPLDGNFSGLTVLTRSIFKLRGYTMFYNSIATLIKIHGV